MDISEFKESLNRDNPPDSLNPLAEALWWDAKGKWHKAHEIAQNISTSDGSRVHAYLHRKEGDLSNAGYWYRRGGYSSYNGPLEEEWKELIKLYLDS